MKKVFLLTISLLFANQMSVDGGLNVSGQVNASSFSGDGSALTNLPSLGGMKPEKIYFIDDYIYTSYTVPLNKIWLVYSSASASGYINNENATFNIFSETNPLLIKSGDIMVGSFGMTRIYEYSTSGSGTYQGMDYIIP